MSAPRYARPTAASCARTEANKCRPKILPRDEVRLVFKDSPKSPSSSFRNSMNATGNQIAPGMTPAGSHGRANLEQLPQELVDMILQFLTRQSCLSLRLTSRRLDAKTVRCVARRYFKSKSFMFTRSSLQALIGIAEHPVFSQVVRTIYFFDCRFMYRTLQCYQTNSDLRDGFKIPRDWKCDPPHRDQIQLYRSFYLDQQKLIETDEHFHMLCTALEAFMKAGVERMPVRFDVAIGTGYACRLPRVCGMAEFRAKGPSWVDKKVFISIRGFDSSIPVRHALTKTLYPFVDASPFSWRRAFDTGPEVIRIHAFERRGASDEPPSDTQVESPSYNHSV